MNAATPLPDPLDLAIAVASRRYEMLTLIRSRRARAAELHAQYTKALDVLGDAERELRDHDALARARI